MAGCYWSLFLFQTVWAPFLNKPAYVGKYYILEKCRDLGLFWYKPYRQPGISIGKGSTSIFHIKFVQDFWLLSRILNLVECNCQLAAINLFQLTGTLPVPCSCKHAECHKCSHQIGKKLNYIFAYYLRSYLRKHTRYICIYTWVSLSNITPGNIFPGIVLIFIDLIEFHSCKVRT